MNKVQEAKKIVVSAVDKLNRALIEERDDFIDEMEANRVYAEQSRIIKDLEKKYGGRAWMRECFKTEKIVIREGISRLGVRGFVAVDENTGVIVSAFKSRESVEADLKKRAKRFLTPGRPSEMDGGKAVKVYLDAESLAIAARIGNGNVSEGIRKALKKAK